MKRATRLVAMCAIVVLLATAGWFGGVLADSAIFFVDTYGVFLNDGTTPVAAGSLVQLIWTSDAAYAPALDGLLDSAGYLLSGDYILYQGPTAIPGGWSGDLDGTASYTGADAGGTYLPSGYVYARVFETNALPGANSWYYQTALGSLVNEQTNVPADSPDTVDVALGGGAGPGGGSVMNLQVAIPEPTSAAIFAVGLASLLIWRRRRP